MVYLIECIRDYDTIYKIGYSKHPSKRINQIKTGNDGNLKLISIFEGKYERKTEKILHNFFSHCKINREWFKLTINDVNDFKNICTKIENNISILEKMKIE